MHWLGLYFDLPAGAVWSNLIASVICVGVAWWRIRARMIAHHLEQRREHDRRHAELKAHITATVAAAVPQKRLAQTGERNPETSR